MLKYRLKKIPKKKKIVWSAMLLIFIISLGSIVGFYAAGNSVFDVGTKAIEGDTVIVNDLTSDWNYYMGLNYTEVTDKLALPGTNSDMTASVSSNKYNINTLVAVQINYNGVDINDNSKVGYISSNADEQQSKLTYYKYIPIVDGKVTVELIDNPYAKRPTNKGFNGWVCDDEATTNSVSCENMTFSYDDDYYLRKVTFDAPSADANGDKKVVINVKASWIEANIVTSTGNIGKLSGKVMKGIDKVPVYGTETTLKKVFKSNVDYYVLNTYDYGRISETVSCANGNSNITTDRWGRTYCNNYGGCSCYSESNDNTIDNNTTYYVSTGYSYRKATDNDFDYKEEYEIIGYDFGFKNEDLLVGYYYKVTNYNNTNKELYYNENGVSCSVTNCGTTAYKLVQYSDSDDIKKWSQYTDDDGNIVINNDYLNYYYLVTRDTNIIDLPSGNYNISTFSSKTVPFTITGSHDGTMSGATLSLNSTLEAGNDMVIENIKISATGISGGPDTSINNGINANYQNVKIGRTIKTTNSFTARGVLGAGSSSASDKKNYVMVEAGNYNTLMALGTSSVDGDEGAENVIFQIGCDYDRVTNNDSNLSVYYHAVSSVNGNHNYSGVLPASELIVKSGEIGSYMLNYTTGDLDNYYMYGIYVGAHSSGDSTAFRTLKVEGGQIFSINGGPCIKDDYDGNVIGIYITGGTVQNVVGGAGVSKTEGNRIISVTGGNVVNAVAGGSNSYSGNTTPGPVISSTLVYVGGNAIIGGTLKYSNTTNGSIKTLYDVKETGSVFGAGLGNNTLSGRGVVKNSHVIIDGNATIKGSVYGGGNYGATGGYTGANATAFGKGTKTLVTVLGGTVNGSVFGGANLNGAGYDSSSNNGPKYLAYDYYVANTVNNNKSFPSGITYWDSKAKDYHEAIRCGSSWSGYYDYGKNNRGCTYYTLVPKGSLYNASTRYYSKDDDNHRFNSVTPQTYDPNAGNTDDIHTITINMYGGTINESLYGGSNQKGDVLGSTHLNLYKGKVIKGVYGGGYGSSTSIQNNVVIKTNTTTNNDLIINELYGGSELGAVNSSGTTDITINGGTIAQVYGGGKGNNDTSPKNDGDITVTLNSGDIGNLFGGTNIRGVIKTKLLVNINGGTVNNVFGGSDGSLLSSTSSDGKVGAENTNVNINGGKIKSAVYGGGKSATTSGTSIVNINGGEFADLDNNGNVVLGSTPAEVFGGGEAAKVTTTYVNVLDGAKLYNVYGGSNKSGVVTTTNVNIESGKILCNSYGGGKIAEVITANSYLKGTEYTYKLQDNETAYINTCGNAFGGGANADVTKANIVLLGGSLLNVYGGSNEGGTVKKSNVYIKNGKTENVFGGNNQGGSAVNSYVDVNEKLSLYIDTDGDGKSNSNIDTNGDGVADLNTADTGTGTIKVTNVFGGSNGLDAAIDETTTTNIYSGVISGDVFGGGNQAKVVEATYVNMYGGTVDNLYGGGNRSFIGDAIVNNLGVLVSGNAVGSTHVNVVNGIINGNVYGSSNASFVYGTTSIKIGDTALNELNIKDNVKRTIFIDGSVFAGSETNVDKSTTYDDNYEGVAGPAGSGTGLIEIDGTSYIENDASVLLIDGSIYGSGNNSKVVNGSNIYITNYGTKNNPVSSTSIQRAKNVYITDSHIELNGTVDRADPDSYRYALIRLDELYLLGSSETNGTYLYLKNGSTFLKALSSGKMVNGKFTAQKVTEKNGELEVSVADNRIYMHAGKVLSVSDSSTPLYDTTTTKAGPVTGMTFLGMYTHEIGKAYVRGIYDYSYKNGDNYDFSKTGSIPSSEYTFVYGLNLTDYTMAEQVKTHGFYTNTIVEDEEDSNDEMSQDGKQLVYQYVGVTPANETTLYYKWLIGVEPVEIVVDLIADKYSESGAVNALITKEELKEAITNEDGTVTKQEWRDAIMTIQSVNTTGFGATSSDATKAFDGILVDKSEIPTINTDDKNGDGVVDANNYFALSMGTTSSGWLDNYKTNFYDNDYAIDEESFCSTAGGNCTGNQIYLYDSTTKQRNLSFWLYHSKNLDFSYVDKSVDPSNMLIYMNQVKIDVEFRNPHGDPTSTDSVQLVTIVVNISLSDGELDKYGGVIAPGKQYEMFQDRPTTIASNGSFSIYQSLSLDLTKTISGSAINEKWDVGKIYHQAKTVEVTDAYGQKRMVDWSESYRYLASSYLLPVGTVVTMLDLKNNEQYYYEVTTENYAAKKSEFLGKNEYKYYLEDFIRMGSTTGNSKYDDDMNEENSTKYYYKDNNSELAIEEFIFTVDFAGADVKVQNPDGDDHYFFLQLARKEFDEEKVIISTNGSPRDEMVYKLKPQVSSEITTVGGFVQEDGTVAKETTIYVGESTQLELETSLIQLDGNGNVLVGVSDTVFDEYKLGAKISVKRPKLDEHNNVVYDNQGNIIYEDVTNDLFGTVMEINGQTYYPQTDGSTRIELAGRITDVISKIDIDFSNSGLTYGNYILVVETFVSYDGLYYGDFEPAYNEYPFELLNNQYGLDVSTEATTQVTHDVNTGEDALGNREIHYELDVVNGLANPNLKVSIERRDYSSIYGTSYQTIPLTNLVEEIRFGDSTTNIISTSDSCYVTATDGECYKYNLGNITKSNNSEKYDIYLKLKNGPDESDLGTNKPNAKWKSGTYKVVYTLYDGDVEVGSVYEYLIIRSLNVDEIVIEGSGN